jgi:hypothetical protein
VVDGGAAALVIFEIFTKQSAARAARWIGLPRLPLVALWPTEVRLTSVGCSAAHKSCINFSQ